MTSHALLRALLIRGLIAGLLAGLLAVAFAELVGEAPLEKAIAFETSHVAAHHHGAAEPEPVGRAVQRGWGLLVAGTAYGVGLGGLFALVYAGLYGRMGSPGPRTLAIVLAAAGMVTIVLAPQLKYPANPPSIGTAETIGLRTGLYFELIAVSVSAAVLAVLLGRRLAARIGNWDAALLAACLFVVVVAGIASLLPDVNEVPDHFPADVLWRFRIASWGMQAVLWLSLGILFGISAERCLRRGSPALSRGSPARS